MPEESPDISSALPCHFDTHGTGSPTHQLRLQKNVLLPHKYLSSPEPDFVHPGAVHPKMLPANQKADIFAAYPAFLLHFALRLRIPAYSL